MKIQGKSLHFICRDRYFYVLLNGRKITLEHFVEAIKEKNKNAVFSHKMLSAKEFFYRDKQYKYSELENRHALNMEIASFYHNNHIAQKELLEYHTLKDGYIIRLLETLDRYINKARHETIKAATIIDIDFLNSKSNLYFYGGYYLQRCYNAENAIFSYYSVYELLQQIIWIYKGYFDSERSFCETLEDCSFVKLRRKLVKENDTQFLTLLCDCSPNQHGEKAYNVKQEFTIVRDWCNLLKHRGILRFDGEKIQNAPKKQIEMIDKSETEEKDFCSEDFAPSFVDLDNEVIPELIAYHRNIIQLAKNIVELTGI